MEKTIKVTITDDTGKVLDTYECDLRIVEQARPQSSQIADDAGEVSALFRRHVREAIARRAKLKLENAHGSAFARPMVQPTTRMKAGR